MLHPNLIKGGTHKDARGALSFVNEFDMTRIKRFYLIEPANTSEVRAWQGHKIEQKWFYCIEGHFKIVTVAPDNWENPSLNLAFTEYRLEGRKPEVLHIPQGYANGFKALKPKSKLLIFSNLSLTEAIDDDYRFPRELWYNWNNY